MMRKINTNIEFLQRPCKKVDLNEAGNIKTKLFLGIKPRLQSAVGLAANQISINKCAFVTNLKGKLKYYINPELIESIGDPFQHLEGCLSLPGQQYYVDRYPEVKVVDEIHGEQHLKDYEAIVWQHEYGHLCGKLILS